MGTIPMVRMMFPVTVLVLMLILSTSAIQNVIGEHSILAISRLSDTVGGYPTWDSDIIKVHDFSGQDVGYTGQGIYVAVLDTGLVQNWRSYFPSNRIRSDLGRGFVEDIRVDPSGALESGGKVHQTNYFADSSGHGTFVTSIITGYLYNSSANTSPSIPPIVVRGIAPRANIIPVKVLATYNFSGVTVTLGTERMIASGLNYVTMLKLKGYSPMVVTMSLGGQLPSYTIERAINYAVNNGVIVVAAAGNNGPGNFLGMTWPGAFPQVISVGAAGWVYEWYGPGFTAPIPGTQGYALWWLQSDKSGYNDILGTLDRSQVYVPFFSSRENQREFAKFSQQLDVLAPGSWVRGPFPKAATISHGGLGDPHLPWWSQGEEFLGKLPGASNFFFVSGTSAATPHVASVAALMLEKYPGLAQANVEMILKTTALNIPPGERTIYDPGMKRFVTVCWECGDISTMAPATGAGLVQADRALAATPGFAATPPLPLLPALPLPAQNDPFRENTNMTILNPVPSLYSAFGGAIAAFEDDILISDPAAGTSAGAGAVYLFNSTTGTLVRTFPNPSPAPYDNFGVSLAVSEDRVLVGANSVSVGALEAGVVYIFNGTTGQLLQTILNPDPQPGDWFGRSVAKLGNDFVISANGKNDLWGTVYVFDNSGSLIHTIMNPKTPLGSVPGTGLSNGDAFGTSIAVVGNNILVGAPGGYHRTNPGTAYLFDGATGQLILTFHSPDQDSFDFGLAVAAAGTNVLVGSPHDDALWPNAGAAYLFDASTGELLHTFLNPSPQAHFLALAGFGGAGDRFGDSVAAIGNYILVGADLHDAGVLREVPFAGVVYAFDSSTGQLVHIFPDPSPHAFDWFGFSIEIVKESIAISTFGGAVYVYPPVARPMTPA